MAAIRPRINSKTLHCPRNGASMLSNLLAPRSYITQLKIKICADNKLIMKRKRTLKCIKMNPRVRKVSSFNKTMIARLPYNPGNTIRS